MRHSRRTTPQLIAHHDILAAAVTRHNSSALIEKLYDIRAELRSRGIIMLIPNIERPPTVSPRNLKIQRRAALLLAALSIAYIWVKWPGARAPLPPPEEIVLTPQQRINQAFDALELHKRGFREESR